MSDLSIKNIQIKLNEAFAEEGRRIIFWYDENKEWADQIGRLELNNAEIVYYEGNNQFELKYKVEHEFPDKNYLIYSLLPKPGFNKNHLLDVSLYSLEFRADSISMFANDLNISKECMPTLRTYSFFFQNTANQDSFKSLGMSSYDDYTIPLGMMCCLCDLSIVSIQRLIVHIISNDNIVDNKYLKIFYDNNISELFWNCCRDFFGWSEVSPTLEKMIITIYLTYFKRDLDINLPDMLTPFEARNSGNITQIFELLKNNKQKYQEYADYAGTQLNIQAIIDKFPIDSIIKCSVFKEVDSHIIEWIISCLINNDLGILVNRKSLVTICDERQQKYIDTPLEYDYKMLKNAALLLSANIEYFSDSLEQFVKDYTEYYYKIDLYYRHFIESYDKVDVNIQYENLQNYCESYYTTSFLSKYISAWNKIYTNTVISSETRRMRKFYSLFVKNTKKKTVVVISDALRYEVAAELFDMFKTDQNCSIKMNFMLGELPSFTPLGMAALLPNKKLDITLNGEVFCDDKQTDTLAKRQSILQSENGNSRCIQYNDFFQLKRDEMRSLLNGIDVLYVYHNQIDSRGESPSSEKEVFNACRDTIRELYNKIKYLGKNANVYHFIITSDHGFIYKRDKLTESDKISDASKLGAYINRRFILSDKNLNADGVCSIKIGDLLGNDNGNYITVPESVNVFKCSGGQNYVHGGSSPQELIIPVVDIDIEKYSVETRLVEIRLNKAIKPKINNLITTFEFLQTEAINSEIKPTAYEVFIANDNMQIISEIHTVMANMDQTVSSERLFKLTFNLKNQEYFKEKTYYLIIRNKETQVELPRTEVIIDIAFSGNFGFFEV
jgi:uncharacterized protein (TIGR02687 family)